VRWGPQFEGGRCYLRNGQVPFYLLLRNAHVVWYNSFVKLLIYRSNEQKNNWKTFKFYSF
jgi:hypothetical protein